MFGFKKYSRDVEIRIKPYNLINYRPLSLLMGFSKILKKGWVIPYNFVMKRNHINNSEHEFLKNSNVEMTLCEYVSNKLCVNIN